MLVLKGENVNLTIEFDPITGVLRATTDDVNNPLFPVIAQLVSSFACVRKMPFAVEFTAIKQDTGEIVNEIMQVNFVDPVNCSGDITIARSFPAGLKSIQLNATDSFKVSSPKGVAQIIAGEVQNLLSSGFSLSSPVVFLVKA